MKVPPLALALACALAAAQTPAPKVGAAPARAKAQQQLAALARFEEALLKEVAQARGTPAVHWRETIVRPDPERLIWGEKTTRVPGFMPLYRAALDPKTRWFYVTRSVGEASPRYFGPIDEVSEGLYEDVFPAPAASAPR
jgi:hypothetical protein